MKKRVLAAVLAVAALSMVGCGSESAVSESDVVASEASAEASVESDAESTVIEDEETAAGTALDPNAEYVYGTATLTYAEFYSGDVSSTDSYDAVSSATAKKYELFTNMNTDYVDETTNAEGYNVLGVKNVNVAVRADQLDEYKSLNDSFVESDTEPSQFKVVNIENGKADYSATSFNIADTVTDAEVELLTGTNWGDYQINVIEKSTSYLRNTREDEGFAVSADVQGVIVETKSGLKVGMEHLQSIWVQPYEISFNISADNSHNSHVSYDNLTELDKLENESIVSVTFINQNDAYVYNFDEVFVKPVYRDIKITATVDENEKTVSFTGIPDDLENATVTATYVVGQGKESVKTVVYEGAASDTVTLDADALAEAKKDQTEEGTYTVVVSSDNYADIAVEVE
ncbi:hypothetical protein [Butyrivibrio sp.]|uniref:hypothetical protein n=1 Tax=Butyrivibrio sp. TaxID=28121 RepID=UPI0025B97BA6|nr:hypothetical protein [Butyrivibrio sp.]MBQ9302848.1 hypothetical protein [Butyrivibrio sp.]